MDHVLSSPSDKALVTSYSLSSFRHRYGARHCSSLSPKEIRELAQRGHETDLAETMLRIFEANLRTFERHRHLILDL